MKSNAKLAGTRMRAAGKLLACFLLIGLSHAASFAQTPGLVQHSWGTDGELLLRLSAKAPLTGTEAFLFEFVGLAAATIEGPDFSKSFCCPDGCTYQWLQSGDTIRGILIHLDHPTFDSGLVAEVAGWPIIDNIDFRYAPPHTQDEMSTLRIRTGNQALQLKVEGDRTQAATIVLRDLRGVLLGQAFLEPARTTIEFNGLRPGIYLVQCYFGTRLQQHKVFVH